MKIAYCDCFSGISGDMFLGALLDAGLGLEYLSTQLEGLGLGDAFRLEKAEVRKGALRATQARVLLKELAPGQGEERHLSEILALIEAGRLSARVKADSRAIFTRLAEAEARVHGQPIEKVHFHEVGALDLIVDIVGAAIGLEALGIEALYASPLPLGGGQVQTRHGLLPLPAPATLELLASAHAPTRPSSAQVELVTPTGAALLATLAKFEQPALTLQKVGQGAGGLELPWPNVLRLILGTTEERTDGGLALLETNLDDMNPQFYAPVMEKLFTAGALDVYLTPIYMKKNRPATMLSVIARAPDEAALANLILRETSTLGLRVQPILRYEAERAFKRVPTPYGEVQVKLKLLEGRVEMAVPEYEDCLRLAKEHDLPLAQVYAAAQQAAAPLLGRESD